MIIDVDKLSFQYPGRKVLSDISFSVEKGECMAILGTNGVGKSTLLKCLNRILKHQSGQVVVQGEDIRTFSRNEYAQKIGYVSQHNQFTRITVFDAVLLGRKPYIRWDATQKDLHIVEEVMDEMGLADFALRFVDELSGGELQKVAIARTLAQQPNILMFDEPTSNLDLKNQLEVAGIIKRIVKERQISAIVTMHDLNLALRFADTFLMVKDGCVYKAGDVSIITPESIMDVYAVPVRIREYDGLPVVIPV